MILSHTAPEPHHSMPDYVSPFNRGYAVISLFMGHAEYDFDEPVEARYDMYEADDGKAMPDVIATVLQIAKDRDIHTYDSMHPDNTVSGSEWGCAVIVSEPITDLWKRFYKFANKLDPECDPADYTPGGDDDTFDYYPSGLDALIELAQDLDELDATLMPKARRQFSAMNRVARIMHNLKLVRDVEACELSEYVEAYLG